MDIYENMEGKKDLLLGNEAIARGAIEAGISVAASYPGTPASEIMETLAKAAPKLNFHVEWSTNEKAAFEIATGASMTGVRSLVSMKNAGINWIMDPLMTVVYGGVRGGFVIIGADDPGAHYSSNEQDTRLVASYAEIPCLEPSTPKEAKEMTKYAFDLSEKIELPVYVRSVTNVSHSWGEVKFGEVNKNKRKPVFDRHYKHLSHWNVYGGLGPVGKHQWLKDQQSLIKEEVSDLPWNEVRTLDDAELGIIASGLSSCYVQEALEILELKDEVAFLKLGISHPLPDSLLADFMEELKQIIVVEEGREFVEKKVKEIAKDRAPETEIMGRSTGHVPEVGELNLDIVLGMLNEEIDTKLPTEEITPEIEKEIKELIIPRSPTFCPGCPHLGTYWALRQVLKDLEDEIQIVNGDIGCYEMGGYGISSRDFNPGETKKSQKYPIDSPYEILDTDYVMGSGIGIMQGQYQAGYTDGPLIAVAGDSTFFHAALPEVVNASCNEVDGLFLILDNRWTSMTGHQPNPCTGENIIGEQTKQLDIAQVAKSLGVTHVQEIDPYDLEESIEAIRNGIKHQGFSVIVSKRVCTLEALRKNDFKRTKMEVNPKKCTSCGNCVELGCPAITYKNETGGINRDICVECGLCAQVCPTKALEED